MDATSTLLGMYRPILGYRILGIGVGIAMMMSSPLLTLAFYINPHLPLNTVTAIAIICANTTMGLWFILATIKYRVVLYQDAIEVVGAVTTRRLERASIGAKRVILGGPCPNYFLIPWSVDHKTLHFEVPFVQDLTFRKWMESIPDADKAFFRNRPSRKQRLGGKADEP